MILLSFDFIRSIFEFSFMRYAIIAGLIVGVLAPLIGSVVVIRRLSFIADTLSHFSLAGVCLGVILSRLIDFGMVSPTIMGVIFSIIGTFLINKLRSYYQNYKEISMPIIMSLGLALSGIFINYSSDINSKYTTSLLYGSIYSVKGNNLVLILIISVLILAFAFFFYKQIITMCFDETYARVSGLNVRLLEFGLTIALSLVISLFIDIIGVLLIASLMILPIASSILIGQSFKQTLLISFIISEISIIIGFVLSFHMNLSTGPVIILINIIVYLIIILIRWIRRLTIKHNKAKM